MDADDVGGVEHAGGGMKSSFAVVVRDCSSCVAS